MNSEKRLFELMNNSLKKHLRKRYQLNALPRVNPKLKEENEKKIRTARKFIQKYCYNDQFKKAKKKNNFESEKLDHEQQRESVIKTSKKPINQTDQRKIPYISMDTEPSTSKTETLSMQILSSACEVNEQSEIVEQNKVDESEVENEILEACAELLEPTLESTKYSIEELVNILTDNGKSEASDTSSNDVEIIKETQIQNATSVEPICFMEISSDESDPENFLIKSWTSVSDSVYTIESDSEDGHTIKEISSTGIRASTKRKLIKKLKEKQRASH